MTDEQLYDLMDNHYEDQETLEWEGDRFYGKICKTHNSDRFCNREPDKKGSNPPRRNVS